MSRTDVHWSPMDHAICVQCRTRPIAHEWRPFCGERCKLLDLGNWADGRYRVAGEATTLADEDDPDQPTLPSAMNVTRRTETGRRRRRRPAGARRDE